MKALMTQYLEGQLVSRDLQQMLVDYAADGRFERELERDNFNRFDRPHLNELNASEERQPLDLS